MLLKKELSTLSLQLKCMVYLKLIYLYGKNMRLKMTLVFLTSLAKLNFGPILVTQARHLSTMSLSVPVTPYAKRMLLL